MTYQTPKEIPTGTTFQTVGEVGNGIRLQCRKMMGGDYMLSVGEYGWIGGYDTPQFGPWEPVAP